MLYIGNNLPTVPEMYLDIIILIAAPMRFPNGRINKYAVPDCVGTWD